MRQVIGAVLPDLPSAATFSPPVVIFLELLSDTTGKSYLGPPMCSYLDVATNTWKTDGITTLSVKTVGDKTIVECVSTAVSCRFPASINPFWEDADAQLPCFLTQESSHLTSFGVLLRVTGKSAISSTDEDALEYITYIGVAISLPCLLAVLYLYTKYPVCN